MIVCSNCGENIDDILYECPSCNNTICEICAHSCKYCKDLYCDACYVEHRKSCKKKQLK